MKEMIRQALPDNPLNLVLMLAFVAVFVGIVAWTFRPGSRERFEKDADLPFKD